LAQSIPNNVATAVTFGSEYYDTDSFHDTSTNTSRITIPSGLGGYYLFTGSGEWANNTTGRRWMFLYKNGSVVSEFELIPQGATATATGFYFQVVSAVATDYFELYVQQTSGGDLNFYPQNTVGFFQASYLGA
jgi:hypothetical protein